MTGNKKKIIISGAGGKMGKVVAEIIKERNDCRVVAGIDLKSDPYDDFPIFKNPFECSVQCDAIIDFSHPSLVGNILVYAEKSNIPSVIATTGLDDDIISEIKRTSKRIPIFFSFNMSLGVSLLTELAKKAAAILSGQYDIEIIEKHHNQKLDAPSGTALMLAGAINDTLGHTYQYKYDRHHDRKKRSKSEIGIHAVRGGTIVGEHEIVFAGHDEVITLSHSAHSKRIFAAGAVNAAMFLCSEKEPGLYDMSHLV